MLTGDFETKKRSFSRLRNFWLKPVTRTQLGEYEHIRLTRTCFPAQLRDSGT